MKEFNFLCLKRLVKHKVICLKKRNKQNVKLKCVFIEFKNYSRQVRARVKIYADFECILESAKSNEKTSGF